MMYPIYYILSEMLLNLIFKKKHRIYNKNKKNEDIKATFIAILNSMKYITITEFKIWSASKEKEKTNIISYVTFAVNKELWKHIIVSFLPEEIR